MAITKVMQMEPFLNDKGEQVNYERLCISGYIGGEIHTLEIKLEKSELLLAKMLLSSSEEKPKENVRKANSEEIAEHSSKVKRNKTILEDDDDDEEGGLFS